MWPAPFSLLCSGVAKSTGAIEPHETLSVQFLESRYPAVTPPGLNVHLNRLLNRVLPTEISLFPIIDVDDQPDVNEIFDREVPT